MSETSDNPDHCLDQRTKQWLEELFEEGLPPFDETPEFIEVVRNIMAKNEDAEKDARAIIKAEKSMKNAYDQKTEELKLLSDFIQLNPATTMRIESLATIAEKMKLKDPSLTNFLLAMVEASRREMESNETNLIFDYRKSVLSKKFNETVMANQELKKDLETFEKTVKKQEGLHSSTESQISYYKQKNDDYRNAISQAQDALNEVGFSAPIRHSALMKKSEELQKLEDEVKRMESKLKAYEVLDVDFSKAQLAIADEEKKLKQFKIKLESLVELSEMP